MLRRMKTDNEITCVVPETLVKEIMKEYRKKHIKELASMPCYQVGCGNGKSQTDLAKLVINSDLPESEKRKMLDAMEFECRKRNDKNER